MSVLTASEGTGLDAMANGLTRRYMMANVDPSQVLYIERDFFWKSNKTTVLFVGSIGGATGHMAFYETQHCWLYYRDPSELYGYFCSRLSSCIFQWSKEDLDALKAVRKSEMEKEGIVNPTDDDVIERIPRRELALHYRRETRGVEATTRLIHNLLETLSGEEECDSLGFPLFDSSCI